MKYINLQNGFADQQKCDCFFLYLNFNVRSSSCHSCFGTFSDYLNVILFYTDFNVA